MRRPYILIVVGGGSIWRNSNAVLRFLVKVVALACNTSYGRSHRGVGTGISKVIAPRSSLVRDWWYE